MSRSNSAGGGGPARWLEFPSYALVALGAVLPALLAPGHVIGDGVDLFGTFWFYWWIQECLASWRDPSFTQLFFYPLGKDIFAHTGNNFVDAVLAQPFLLLFGYPRFQPVFIAVVLLGNALAFRPLARLVCGPTYAAWGSTLLWQLSPFVLFELIAGRITQAFLWWVPLAVYHFLRIPERRRDAPLAGLYAALTGWTYWFMGYFLAFGLGWLALAALLRREVTRATLRGWLIAGATCLLLIAPAAVAMSGLAETGQVPGLSGSGGVLEGPAKIANNVSQSLHGSVMMETKGQPMLLLWTWAVPLVLYAIFGRDRPRWLGWVLVTLAFSVGPVWSDENPTVMPHYMLAYRYLPFFDRLWFPYRMVGMTLLGAALGAGLLLRRLEEGRLARLPWLAPAMLALLTIAEQRPWFNYPLLHRDLTPPSVYADIGRIGGALVELPIGVSRISIAWQPLHGQPTFGGMGENASVLWPPGYKQRLSNSLIQFLRQITRDPAKPRPFQAAAIRTLRAEGFRWVVLDRRVVETELRRKQGQAFQPAVVFEVQAALVQALGAPWAVDRELVVWDLSGEAPPPPDALAPTPERLAERAWEPEQMPQYEQHLRELGRLE